MPYGDKYQQLNRGPLKGGGGIKTKPIAQPITMMSILEKFALPLLRALRAGLKNWKTTVIGIAMIVLGVADGTDVNMEAIIAGIGLIFAHDANKSSQDSGVRPEVLKHP